MPTHYLYLMVFTYYIFSPAESFPPSSIALPRLCVRTHHSVLLDLLVVGDDLPDAVDKTALVVRNEAHEYSLLGGVEQHQHPHFTGRGGVGKVDTASLREIMGKIKTLTWESRIIMGWGKARGADLLLSSFVQSNISLLEIESKMLLSEILGCVSGL